MSEKTAKRRAEREEKRARREAEREAADAAKDNADKQKTSEDAVERGQAWAPATDETPKPVKNWVGHVECHLAPPFSGGKSIADDDDEFDAGPKLAPGDLALPYLEEAATLLGNADIYDMDTRE